MIGRAEDLTSPGIMVRYYYVKDHLGSIRQTIDQSGSIKAAQDYYPYGETLRGYNSGLSNEKYKYNEKELDAETGLFYYGARYFDPVTGIWYQTDPLWEKYRGLSPYNYTLNNPLRFIDPHGLSPESVLELQDRYEQMMERERQRHGGSYSPENGGGEDGWGSMLLDLLGLKTAGPKYESKSEEDIEDEIIVNQGITDQEKANMQFATVETYVTFNAKCELMIAGYYIGGTALGAEGLLQTSLFGAMSLVPSLGLDIMNYVQNGNIDFTGTGISLGAAFTSGASVGLLSKKAGNFVSRGAGIGSMIYSTVTFNFDYEVQRMKQAFKYGF